MITEHITENAYVSSYTVRGGTMTIISRNSPLSPVSEKSAGRDREAAADVAEESASSDCASEAGTHVCSSTAVFMGADMV